MKSKALPVFVALTAGLAAAFGIGYWLGPGSTQTHAVDAEILRDRVSLVLKMVNVEGRFSEILDYRDYWGLDIAPLRKKALVRVAAKVAVGLDLEQLQVKIDEANRRLVLSKLPDPEILSIDLDLDYYDITEGTFNSFSEQDLTQLQREARALILRSAEASDLVSLARQQAEGLLQACAGTVRDLGWNLVVSEGPPLPGLPPSEG